MAERFDVLARGYERFPDWRGRDLVSPGPADKFVRLAGDGATSSDVAGRQLAALGDLVVVPVALTVSMGGNDLLSVFGDTPATKTAIAGTGAQEEPASTKFLLVEAVRAGALGGIRTHATGSGGRCSIP